MKNNQFILFLEIAAGVIVLSVCSVLFFYFILFLFGGFHDWARNVFLTWLAMFLIVLVIFITHLTKSRRA